MIKIAFPEIDDFRIKRALQIVDGKIKAVGGTLDGCMEMLRDKKVDAVIAGKVFTSREVIISAFNILGKSKDTFVGSVITNRGEMIADVATCKEPTEEQLYDIVCQSRDLFYEINGFEPTIAMLSYSTAGSGGDSIQLNNIRNVIKRVKQEHPNYDISSTEVQLDVALDWEKADDKGERELQGQANLLICPDLNSGNILYKSVAVFGGRTIAGPILTGFNGIVSDLSRGSSIDDIVLTIHNVCKMVRNREIKKKGKK